MRLSRSLTIACTMMAAVAFAASASTHRAPHTPPRGSVEIAQSNTCHFVYFGGKTQDGQSDTCLRCVTGYYSATKWTSCPVRQAPNSNFVQCEPWNGASAASPGSMCASPYPTPATGIGPAPEAATSEIVNCNGHQFYIYTYLNRPAFRAILPPDWSHAIGGRDFSTRQQAVDAACGTAGGTIRVTTGTLGANCGVNRGNVTNKVGAICNGKDECTLTGHDVGNPDPAPNCAKDFSVEWQCSGQGGTRSNANPATTNETTPLTLSCKTASAAGGGGISLLGVPYAGGGSGGTTTSGTGRATANGGSGGTTTSGTGRATANVGAGASQVIAQQEIRDRSGRLTQEAAKIYVVTCQSGRNKGRPIYIYQYLRRAGFRAIMPPDWSHAMGNRDFATYDEALSAGCPR